MSINEIMELTALLKEQAREDIRKENEYIIEHGETDDPQLSFFDDEEEFDDDKTEKASEPKEGYLRVHTWFGDYDVIIYRSTYYGTENLAIQLFTEEEPFATLTVNLGGFLEPNEAYVDTIIIHGLKVLSKKISLELSRDFIKTPVTACIRCMSLIYRNCKGKKSYESI